MKDKIEELKKVLPAIKDSIELRKESVKSLCGPCPKCGGKDRFVYRTDTQRFWCRQCNEKGGDVIDFHKWIEGKEIEDLFKKYLPEQTTKKKTFKKTKPSEDFEKLWNKSRQKYTNTTPVYDFFEDQRKISHKTIAAAIGAGVINFVKYKGISSVAARYQNLNEGKDITAIQYISAYKEPLNSEGATKIFKHGSAARHGFFQTGKNIEDAKVIILSESAVNGLSITDVFPDVCSLVIGGSGLTKKVKDLRPYRDRGVRIIIFFDNDDAGDKATREAAKIIGKNALNVKWPPGFPEGTDVNDLLMAGKQSLIKEMIEAAEHDPEYNLISECKSTYEDLVRRINETSDFHKLAVPINRDVAGSGLPSSYVDKLQKSISKKTGVTLKALRADAQEQYVKAKDLSHLEIAKSIIEDYGKDNIIFADSFFWTYKNTGVWIKTDDRKIMVKIHEMAGGDKQLTKNFVSSVLDLTKTEAFRPDHRFNISGKSINCLNGELHWSGVSASLKLPIDWRFESGVFSS